MRKMKKFKLNYKAEKLAKEVLTVLGAILMAIFVVAVCVFGTIDLLANNIDNRLFPILSELASYFWRGIPILILMLVGWWVINNLEEVKDRA